MSRGSNVGRFSGEALSRARDLRGLSKSELSRRAFVSRQTIEDLEGGVTRDPSPATTQRLCEALELSSEFLYFEPGETPPAEALHLRSRHQTIPKYVTRRLQAKAELFVRICVALERHVHLPEVTIPGVRANKLLGAPEIQQAAARCRSAWGLGSQSPIVNLTRVLERAGVLVGGFFDEYAQVQAFCWLVHRPLIYINRFSTHPGSVSVTRVRYDLAHEVGHIVLHGGSVAGDPAREREANRFAAELLLPRDLFAASFRTYPRSIDWDCIWQMKSQWGVSAQAIVYRAHELGMFSDDLYRRFWMRLNKEGWRKREPHEPSIAEEPEITRGVASALQTELGVTPWEVAQSIGLTPALFAEMSGISVEGPNNVVQLAFARRLAGRGLS